MKFRVFQKSNGLGKVWLKTQHGTLHVRLYRGWVEGETFVKLFRILIMPQRLANREMKTKVAFTYSPNFAWGYILSEEKSRISSHFCHVTIVYQHIFAPFCKPTNPDRYFVNVLLATTRTVVKTHQGPPLPGTVINRKFLRYRGFITSAELHQCRCGVHVLGAWFESRGHITCPIAP